MKKLALYCMMSFACTAQAAEEKEQPSIPLHFQNDTKRTIFIIIPNAGGKGIVSRISPHSSITQNMSNGITFGLSVDSDPVKQSYHARVQYPAYNMPHNAQKVIINNYKSERNMIVIKIENVIKTKNVIKTETDVLGFLQINDMIPN